MNEYQKVLDAATAAADTYAKKFDNEKPALFLNPPEIQYGMARAFMHGERKYGTYNWMGGLKVSRLWSACVRHLLAWFWEQTPDESGLDHLDHAAASLAMLMDTAKRFPELDDRPKKEARSDSPSSK